MYNWGPGNKSTYWLFATPSIHYISTPQFFLYFHRAFSHSLQTNVEYDKDVLIFYNENRFGLVEVGHGRLQSNAEMGGEGGSHELRDILRGTLFHGLSAETCVRDLQFLHRCKYRFTSSGVWSCVTLLAVRDVSKERSSFIPKVQGHFDTRSVSCQTTWIIIFHEVSKETQMLRARMNISTILFFSVVAESTQTLYIRSKNGSFEWLSVTRRGVFRCIANDVAEEYDTTTISINSAGSSFLWNVGTYLQDYTASKPLIFIVLLTELTNLTISGSNNLFEIRAMKSFTTWYPGLEKSIINFWVATWCRWKLKFRKNTLETNWCPRIRPYGFN